MGNKDQAVTSPVAMIPLPGRTQIELRGADRAVFLQNLCTNDVRKLQPGEGCEAFFTNIKAKVLAHVFIFAGTDAHLIDTAPGQTETVLQHLDRYLIREDVQLNDLGHQRSEILLSGTESPSLLKMAGVTDLPKHMYANIETHIDDIPLTIYRIPMVADPCFLLATPEEFSTKLCSFLLDNGVLAWEEGAFHAARIAQGFPLYGIDICSDDLAQEVNRDEQAISYVKGCYLGQEPIARIDALGHVNRSLVGLQIDSPNPPMPGTLLFANEKEVGRITSSTTVANQTHSLALAYLSRRANSPGTSIRVDGKDAKVISLP